MVSQCTNRTSMEDHKEITKLDLYAEMSLNTNLAWHYLFIVIFRQGSKELDSSYQTE